MFLRPERTEILVHVTQASSVLDKSWKFQSPFFSTLILFSSKIFSSLIFHSPKFFQQLPNKCFSIFKKLQWFKKSVQWIKNCTWVYHMQSFPYENHCKCCKKLASRSWPRLITLTYFFFYVHSSSWLESKKCCDCCFLQQIRP